jgi:DNA modification methylase
MENKIIISDATLYLSNCLDIMKTLQTNSIDAIVTDPPYGINFKYASYDDTEENWYNLMNAVVPEMIRIAKCVVLPSCAIKRLGWWYANYPPDWLIAWYKGSPGHVSKIGFNDWEPLIVYGKPFRSMHDYFQTACGFEDNGHPCPKPVAWAKWLCGRVAPINGTIFDPFMGSGTTGVACAQLNRKFIGCEIDPVYYDISVKRVTSAHAQLSLLEKWTDEEYR